MPIKTWAQALWGKNAKLSYLLVAAAILLLSMLGSRELWTQEHRWADIVSGMFFRHDFLHPFLGETEYYDKPLLSYWLMAGISFVTGKVSLWSLRLPSALAGMLSVWSIYKIGSHLKDKQLGLLAGWMLLTSFYFVFWAKTSSADMLNLGGTLFAVAWYFMKKESPSFINYTVFFMILALTALCKGLVGAIVPLLAIFPDLLMKNEWKKHLRLSFVLATIPAAIIYYLPFWASAHFGGTHYEESGLYLVYRENILRYFQPFDHKGPIYTYFIYLPVYLMPWTLFFIPALLTLPSRWRNLSSQSKWMCWSLLVLFLFFTLSGSRRNYYVLPIVPFAVLMTADWILAQSDIITRKCIWAGRLAITFFVVLFLNFNVLQPLYYADGGINSFAEDLKAQVLQIKPWSDWQFVMLDPEAKISFYLDLPPTTQNYAVLNSREAQTPESLLKSWPMLKQKNSTTIYITRKCYEPILRSLLPHYRVVSARPTLGERVLTIENSNAPVAFIP
ncbi:MAG: glycosyltransferase family 39 protein [Gammaproteobacteria bacterium]|nr:glycosyltransferase family 39 protein [Gammaproteobacteria bacterium]